MVWAGDGVGRVGHDGRDFKKKKLKKKKSAVIDYFAGKVSQITRPFNLKLWQCKPLIVSSDTYLKYKYINS